jgi:hypothetical protein
MSLIDTTAAETAPVRRPKDRPSIPCPDGDTLQPRAQFAAEIRISERTVTRMNLPTTYVGSVAYIKRKASLQIIANGVKRRNEPARRRRSKK